MRFCVPIRESSQQEDFIWSQFTSICAKCERVYAEYDKFRLAGRQTSGHFHTHLCHLCETATSGANGARRFIRSHYATILSDKVVVHALDFAPQGV